MGGTSSGSGSRSGIPPPALLPSDAGQSRRCGGEVPFSRWNDVLETLPTACPPMYGVLVGSTAVLRGDLLLIETDNDLFRSLVSRDGNKALLVKAIGDNRTRSPHWREEIRSCPRRRSRRRTPGCLSSATAGSWGGGRKE